MSQDNISNKNIQRFNKYGMTGCLNIYNSELNQTNFLIYNGQCEDSLNIVKSHGNIKRLDILNSFSDAVDMDYSKIKIKSVNIDVAGNDCIDLVEVSI